VETNEAGFNDPGDPERLVGSIFAGRHRLTRLLSAGANTVIYDADDLESRRPVTIKVVQPDLGVSSTFRERFDRTIRSVASLSHPNIAAVYDWGEATFDGKPTVYVVIEQLTKGSLRDLYDRGRRLSPSQALAVGLDACRALDHAHRRGFVHGELTPSKLVFGDDRRLRIVDFGLAALLGEQAWDEPATMPTHVARYASPEQALSLPIDGTTDVYALCLTLVEGVTGVLPFAADSTVATLAARIGRLMPVSADLGPLASVLERAGRPHADERSTAAQFGQSLVQAAEKLPRPEPLPLLSTGLFETPIEQLRTPDDPTGGVARPATPDTDRAAGPDELVPDELVPDELVVVTLDEPDAVHEPDVDDVEPEPIELEIAVSDPVVEEPEREPEPEPEPEADFEPAAPSPLAAPATVAVEEPASKRRGVVVKVLAALVLIAALVALAVLAIRLFATPSYDVPSLGGLEQSAALAEIAEFGWDVTVESERSDDEPRPGHVVRTVPPSGERLAEGEPFLLVVSGGPVLRPLPELVGLTFVEAEAQLVGLGLVPVIDEAFDEDVPLAGVVSWSVPGQPELVAGDEVLPGTEVEIISSLGPAPRTVPELVGASLADARAALGELRLELVEGEQVFDDVVPPGFVVTQAPDAGTELERGATVTVVLSRGPDLVIFPDLSGLTFPEAQAALAEAGLVARLEFGASDGEFVSAAVDGEPAVVGAPYRRGTQVDLVFL
jgi:eukaryotic-like serine/threonine-protein kinase